MRHRVKTLKLGRKSQHRDAMLANLVVSLIEHGRLKTTVVKAKAMRPLAEKMVTLGKKADLSSRRLAMSELSNSGAVSRLFKVISPLFKERKGGYTRIIRVGQRISDAAPMAMIEWTEFPVDTEISVDEAKPKDEASKS